MNWPLIIIALVAIVPIFFVWANHRTKKQHATFSKDDVVSAIQNVISGSDHDEWDLFLSWPIQDPYLESIRQRCIDISKEYSGVEKGKDIASQGEAKLNLILNELENRA
ncbi:MAG TPA: hypothetical protein VL357_07575 [Rariglobus sp.]|jgi:hypothetical protein|nr:hypothetical protein [Rariglobus sp.]